MEHILQFAIGIDDEGIKRRIEEKAEAEIVREITQDIRNNLFERSYYRGNADSNSPLNGHARKIVEDFLNDNKEEILEKAGCYLAEKLARSKAGKALLEGVNDAK